VRFQNVPANNKHQYVFSPNARPLIAQTNRYGGLAATPIPLGDSLSPVIEGKLSCLIKLPFGGSFQLPLVVGFLGFKTRPVGSPRIPYFKQGPRS